ncbi:MAG: helix-turn-helix transcriptional regulator [Acutalibacter sp.]|nr:helix-turn-helix transcriptional regulator [Acutalibacter sp.]
MPHIGTTKKVSAELLCLSLLGEKDMYVYEITQEINRRSQGYLDLAEAAIYVTMYRLVEKGLVLDKREVAGEGKPRLRVYYHITERGKEYYRSILEAHQRSMMGLENFFAFQEPAV